MMKNLIIIGAGGMGRHIYNLALQCEGCGREYQIKGFIDDNLCALDGFKGYPSIVGKISDYEICQDDVFTNALGDITIKKDCIQAMLTGGAEFITLIHPTAIVNSNAQIGMGCIIDSSALIDADVRIGDFTLIQVGTIVGHDVIIGNWSRIDNHVTLVGGVSIGNEVCIHTNAVINHRVKINDRVCVGAGSFVIRSVKEGITVCGNPAKRLI